MHVKVSIKKISEATGFSPATISNALNHKKGVNKETAAQVFRVAKEMGYIEENRITKIKLVIFKRNGLIVDDTPFFPLLLNGVEEECRNLGFEMVMVHLDYRDSDFEEQVRWIINDNSAAIILLGTELMEEDIDIFRAAVCPLVTLDYWSKEMLFDGILINNSDSARMATEYLIAKGHKDIGYLRGSYRIKAFRSRAVGYQVAMQKARLTINEEHILTLGTTMDSAYRDMLDQLKVREVLPTAFFADNDMIAIGAIKALKEMGHDVPGEISVVGFDDLPYCEMMSPRLTTIHVSKREMGQVAVRRINELILQKADSKLKIQVCTKLIERDSVREIK